MKTDKPLELFQLHPLQLKCQPLLLWLTISIICPVFANGQTISGIVNSYYQVTMINAGSNTVTVSNASGLTAKTRVLLIQMKGAAIDGSNSASYGNITAINNAGNYEINTICNVSGNNIVLQYQILNSYTTTEPVQLITIPSYPSVTVSDTVTAIPWNDTVGIGGVVAIEATDTIYLNSAINVAGQGFEGGALINYPTPDYDCSFAINVTDYYLATPASGDITAGEKGEGVADYISGEENARGNLANGGGGGNVENTGGGGGGNVGTGGLGGERTMESAFDCHGYYPGLGGIGLSAFGYSAANNRVFMGGGGGAGHENNAVGLPGGGGGGIVLLTAPVIVSDGISILADGGRPYNAALTDPYQASGDGAGGGGAGGTVLLNVQTVSGSLNVSVTGAAGGNSSYPYAPSCMGPGGGGGGGIVWVEGSSFPGNITATVTGGVNGVISPENTFGCAGSANDATPGTAGTSQSGYILPQSPTRICTPLPIPGLQSFTGAMNADGTDLYWSMYSLDQVAYYTLQTSQDRVNFTNLAIIHNKGNMNLSYMDDRVLDGTIYYRLILTNTDGTRFYSDIIALTRTINNNIQFVSLKPNPATDQLSVTLYAKAAESSQWVVCNSMGQTVCSSTAELSAGYNNINLPVSGLSSGAYFLKFYGSDFIYVKNFIKQ